MDHFFPLADHVSDREPGVEYMLQRYEALLKLYGRELWASMMEHSSASQEEVYKEFEDKIKTLRGDLLNGLQHHACLCPPGYAWAKGKDKEQAWEAAEPCESCEWRPLTDEDLKHAIRRGSMGEKFFACEICEKITMSDNFIMSAQHVCTEGVKLCDRCAKAVEETPTRCPRVTHYRIDPSIPPFDLTTNEEKLNAILAKTPHALEVLTCVEDIMGGCVDCDLPPTGEACPVTCEDVKNWNRVITVWVTGKEGVCKVED